MCIHRCKIIWSILDSWLINDQEDVCFSMFFCVSFSSTKPQFFRKDGAEHELLWIGFSSLSKSHSVKWAFKLCYLLVWSICQLLQFLTLAAMIDPCVKYILASIWLDHIIIFTYQMWSGNTFTEANQQEWKKYCR